MVGIQPTGGVGDGLLQLCLLLGIQSVGFERYAMPKRFNRFGGWRHASWICAFSVRLMLVHN